MAWNQPGGGKDPWGGGNTPPELDQALRELKEKFSGIFGGGGKGAGGDGQPGGGGFAFFAGALLMIALVWSLFGIYQVDAKEKAVILRFGKYLETVGDGLHWNPPLIDSRTIVRVTEERQYQVNEKMLTEDENIVELPLTVHYNIRDVKAFVLGVKEPELSLREATNSALRHVVGSSKLDDVVSTGREKLGDDVEARLQNYLDNYGTGIHIIKINIQEAKPPTEVKAAYDDVIKAREDQERLVNEAQAYANGIIPEARGRAQRVIEEATAYQSRVVAEAEGEAQRFEKLLGEYRKAPEVTRQRLYLEAVQKVMSSSTKVMVDVDGGNNMLYLPLDKMLSQQPAGGTPQRSLSASDISVIADEVIDKLRRQPAATPRREVR